MSIFDRFAALLPDLHREFPSGPFTDQRPGRWLGIRGDTCIRAHNATELRERIHRHLAEIAADISGNQP